MTRQITGIIIHCAATPNGQWQDVQNIDRWHQARGFSRADQFVARHNPDLLAIGYHFVIYINGALATGRHLDEVGAHARGFNSESVGVCLVGTDKFTKAQWITLNGHIRALQKVYPLARVVGHRDLPNVHKTCPGFDVADWLANDMQPLPEHVLSEVA